MTVFSYNAMLETMASQGEGMKAVLLYEVTTDWFFFLFINPNPNLNPKPNPNPNPNVNSDSNPNASPIASSQPLIPNLFILTRTRTRTLNLTLNM